METFYTLVWLFFCYSFLGWLAETAAAAAKQRKYVDRSLLFGPVCIVYGAAGVLIGGVLRELAGDWFFLFLGSVIYATVVEWIAGHALERLTHTRWWDYSRRKWNLDGYICLTSSLLWGLMGVVAVKWLEPLLVALRHLLPPLVGHVLLWALVAVFLVDCLATALTLAGVVHKLPAVEEAGSRLAALTVRLGAWVLGKTEGRIRRAHPAAEFQPKPRAKPAVFAQGCGFYKVFWLFLMGAFLGDIVETLFCRVTMGVWMSRSSVVWGPFSIVWGLALAFGTLLLYRYKDRSDRFLFVAGTLLGGAYEYLCSVFTEIVFGTVFWDYSHIPFNLGGRVNLLYCFFWGFAAVAWLKLCYPAISRLIERLPRTLGRVLTWILVVFMAANVAVSSLALARCDERARGIPADSAWEQYMDDHYPDQRMARIYPAAVRVE